MSHTHPLSWLYSVYMKLLTVALLAAQPPVLNRLGEMPDCVHCPVCLRSVYQGCVGPPIRTHKNCKHSNSLCTRSIYECPGAGIYFTYPTVRNAELSVLYKAGFKGEARLIRLDHPRPMGQLDFVLNHMPPLPVRALVVEIGCSYGTLLRLFAQPRRTLVCFEPTPRTAARAKTVLQESNASKTFIFNGLWNPEQLREAVGEQKIDLLLSSHVLEHMPDLCSFTSSVFDMMNVNGVVFTEVPNHTGEYVKELQGGNLHLNFPTPRGFMLLMESAGFVVAKLSTYRTYSQVAARGAWIRSVFIKPDERHLNLTYGLSSFVIPSRSSLSSKQLARTRHGATAASELARHEA